MYKYYVHRKTVSTGYLTLVGSSRNSPTDEINGLTEFLDSVRDRLERSSDLMEFKVTTVVPRGEEKSRTYFALRFLALKGKGWTLQSCEISELEVPLLMDWLHDRILLTRDETALHNRAVKASL